MYNFFSKRKESFTENSLNVTEEILGTRTFASLLLGVPIAGSISLNGRQISVIVLCTLQSP